MFLHFIDFRATGLAFTSVKTLDKLEDLPLLLLRGLGEEYANGDEPKVDGKFLSFKVSPLFLGVSGLCCELPEDLLGDGSLVGSLLT